jgi:hypothetical protein
MSPKHSSRRIEDLLASVTDDLITDVTPLQDAGLRVERILLDLIRPDPIQPRRVLPEQVHFAFHHSELTPAQALRELIRLVQVTARQKGRPFHSVLELLPNPDRDEDDKEVKLTPEEELLRDLTNLAVTIRDDGQVNPLTVVNVTQGVSRMYRIETGERRYWATWLLRSVIEGYTGDGTIPCIVIPAERSSVFRQAKENTARAGLTAVAMARQAALLLLTVHGYEIPAGAVTNDFYRQALDLDLRSRREHTDNVLASMGGIGKMHFSRLKALLRLADEALDLADRHNIEEKRLRHVLNVPTEYHAEIMRQIIDFNLTSREVQELCEGNGLMKDEDVFDKLPASVMKVVRMAQITHTMKPQEMARAFMYVEGDVNMARARLQALRTLLTETEVFLMR